MAKERMKSTMSMYQCPKGHESTEPDFCSDCGAKIVAPSDAEAAISPPPVVSSDLQICPDCTAPHDQESGDFCEICGYNFVTGAHGEVALPSGQAGAEMAEVAAAETPGTGVAAPRVPLKWQVVITVDAVPHHQESPPAPPQSAIAVTLEKVANLIGRTSQVRAIYPEIAIDFDDAISHRHAVLTVQPDRTLILRDIGSSNGTTLNGIELLPMVDMPVGEGDEITLGHWTRLQITGC
jgi:FHA domain